MRTVCKGPPCWAQDLAALPVLCFTGEVTEPEDLLPPVLLQQRQQIHSFVPRPLVLKNSSGWTKVLENRATDAPAGMAVSCQTGSCKPQVISLSLLPPSQTPAQPPSDEAGISPQWESPPALGEESSCALRWPSGARQTQC